jgi:uncharacterized membrane protein
MTLLQYRKIRLATVFVTAVIFSQSIIFHNFIIPIAVLAASSLMLFYLRKKVKGIVSDERDYVVGGKSALLAIQVFSTAAVIVMFFLYSSKDSAPYYEPIALTLAISVCTLMVVYSVIFKYQIRRGTNDAKQDKGAKK